MLLLDEFIVKAKKFTYALGEEAKVTVFDDGTNELIYEEEKYKYRDRFYGFNPFVGEEIVWYEGKILWGMNYCGRIIPHSFTDLRDREIFAFLQKALMNVRLFAPFRGPEVFIEKPFRYLNRFEGHFGNFDGKEEIRFKGEQVYFLRYHGIYLEPINQASLVFEKLGRRRK